LTSSASRVRRSDPVFVKLLEVESACQAGRCGRYRSLSGDHPTASLVHGSGPNPLCLAIPASAALGSETDHQGWRLEPQLTEHPRQVFLVPNLDEAPVLDPEDHLSGHPTGRPVGGRLKRSNTPVLVPDIVQRPATYSPSDTTRSRSNRRSERPCEPTSLPSPARHDPPVVPGRRCGRRCRRPSVLGSLRDALPPHFAQPAPVHGPRPVGIHA